VAEEMVPAPGEFVVCGGQWTKTTFLLFLFDLNKNMW